MIVADASWVIALRDPGDPHHDQAIELATTSSNDTIAVHSVTFAECLVGAAHLGELHGAAASLRAAFDIVGIDDDGPLRWALLRSESGLRLPGAIVLDTAIVLAADTILTFDQRLASVARGRSLAVPVPDTS